MLNSTKMILRLISILPILILSGCYGVNEKTTKIGNLNSTCLHDSAWTELTKKYSTDRISSDKFLEGLERVKNYTFKPDYILYFPSGPEEIIGCDYYTVRTVFNPELSNMAIDGLDYALKDEEQVRVRNRVQKLLMQYQCEKGKLESEEWLEWPAACSD
jgi:hypothetical protein